MFNVFLVMRQLHEMLWYLSMVYSLEKEEMLRSMSNIMIQETIEITLLRPEDLLKLNLDIHREKVNEVLRKASNHIRSKFVCKNNKTLSKNYIGKNLNNVNLRGADLSGAFLIAADLSNNNLSGVNRFNIQMKISGGDLMTIQIYIVLFLTLIIYTIGTLAYSVRVVGIKTGRIAVAFAVFNIFALVSRTANTFQAPLLAKTIENSINTGNNDGLLFVIRLILVMTTLATIIGALLMPTFIKIFCRLVDSFSIYRSIPKLLVHGFSKSGVEQFKKSITIPKREDIVQFKEYKKVPKKIILLSIITSSISFVGVLSSLYAGFLNPELRTTCSTLSSVINSIATILMFVFIDPFLSIMTDDVIKGKVSEVEFNRCIIFIVGSLIIGSILAQFLLIPASKIILLISEFI